DQGFQYTSQAYFNLTKEYGIMPSMSRRGNPYDNAMAENFFSILKAECIHRQKIQTLTQAQELIDDYIHFYNFERFQINYRLTPSENGVSRLNTKIFYDWLFSFVSIFPGAVQTGQAFLF
ncbi:IS3 family transposase, partial [Propionispora vibrioides]